MYIHQTRMHNIIISVVIVMIVSVNAMRYYFNRYSTHWRRVMASIHLSTLLRTVLFRNAIDNNQRLSATDLWPVKCFRNYFRFKSIGVPVISKDGGGRYLRHIFRILYTFQRLWIVFFYIIVRLSLSSMIFGRVKCRVKYIFFFNLDIIKVNFKSAKRLISTFVNVPYTFEFYWLIFQ